MKLSEYAKRNNITYCTALRHWKAGLINGKQLATGTIVIYEDEKSKNIYNRAILYARVSSSENKNNLESQLKRLKDYSAAKGYQVIKEVKEIGSGLNDNRRLLESVLQSDQWDIIIVEHKDRLARFGINYIRVLLEKLDKKIEIINETNDNRSDLMEDFVSIITSFTARLYGQRRSKRKTEQFIKQLKETNDQINEDNT